MNIVVSAKIPKDLKEKATRYGIEISKTFREALEKKVLEAERERNGKKMTRLRSSIGHIERKDVTRAVRASRDER